jgi:2'-5' RNA ligase
MTFPWHDGSDISPVMNPLEQPSNTPLDPDAVIPHSASEPTNVASDDEDDESGLSDDEVEMLLNGDLTPLGLTAAVDEVHTGAMIALLPTIADQARLAVPGGEDEEELHLTLMYLGDAAKIPPTQREAIIMALRETSQRRIPIVDAEGFAVSVFNPEDPEKDTCVVLQCSGPELATVYREVRDLVGFSDNIPDQHVPWIPHVTLAYTSDSSMVSQLTDRTGPIRFDVIRVVFGEEATDFPLYDGTASFDSVEEDTPMVADAQVHGVDVTLAGGKESDVNRKGGSHNLLNHWVHGPGAAEIGWGTDGAMERCIAKLGKYVKNPGGLCNEYHQKATGEAPTKKGGVPSAVDIQALEAEVLTADAQTVDLETELGEYDGGWEGPIVQEDTDTGDQRMFSGGSLHWADTESIIHPLQWAQQNLGEHKGSVTAGRIDTMWRSPDNPRVIMGKGRFNVGDPDGLRAFRQVRDGFAGGISVDPDQVTDADVELEFAMGEDGGDPFAKPTKTIFHSGRLRGATLVAFPALIEASIKLTKKGESSTLVASVTDAPWRPAVHELRLPEDEGKIDGLTAAAAFAFVRDIDDVVSRQQCRFLHHEVAEDGTPGRASLVACMSHIDTINKGRSFGLTHSELHSAYDHMAQHLIDAGRLAPAFSLQTSDAVVASIPATAPLEWFGNPSLSGPTPVTVTDDGRVFGHAACWGACHTGFADTCVTPPMENDYGYFTTGEVLTAEGHRVAVGQITLGTSHAPTRGVSLARAIDHYGDTGTAVADVTAGTDDHGIWIAGAVRPGVSGEHLHALRASALSGDWRRIGGSLRMVALLAVNVPGFPIPRLGTALAAGKQVSLVAAGVVDRSTFTFDDEIALLAGSCGISGVHDKVKKYKTMADELVALSTEIGE